MAIYNIDNEEWADFAYIMDNYHIERKLLYQWRDYGHIRYIKVSPRYYLYHLDDFVRKYVILEYKRQNRINKTDND